MDLTDESTIVYHYDVTIESKNTRNVAGAQGDAKRERKLTREKNRKIINELIERESRDGGLFWSPEEGRRLLVAYDGVKNLYIGSPINEIGLNRNEIAEKNVRIKDNECKEGFSDHKVKIKVAYDETDPESEAQIDWQSINDYYEGGSETFPTEALMVLNTIMRSGSLKSRFAVGANSMYHVDCDRHYLGRGLEFAFGHFQSVRPVAAGLSIVIDRTATAFIQNITAIEYIKKIMQRGDREPSVDDFVALMNPRHPLRKDVEDELSKVHFYTEHMGYRKVFKKFFEITDNSSERISFQSETGTITVAQYFRRQYNIQLRFPQFPCLDFGSDEKHNYIPVELVKLVENQHYKGLLKGDQNSTLIRATATDPRQRFLELQEFAHSVKNEGAPYLQEFNIDMDIVPIRAWGKVLAPPKLVYGNKVIEAEEGKWNMINVKVVRPVRIERWMAFQFDGRGAPDRDRFANFINQLRGTANNMGIFMNEPMLIETNTFMEGGKRLRDVVTQMKPKFILFVHPKDDLFRARVKHFCEVTNGDGVLSQCVQTKVYDKANLQVQANILLKINTKCGGVNHVLQTKPASLRRQGGVIVFGADVTHSAPANVLEKSLTATTGGESFDASIAAVVGTTDQDFFSYYTEVKVQRKERQEMITQLASMMQPIIQNYYMKNNKNLPENIVFYRDGVSEGQFFSVLKSEVAQMDDMFKKISAIVKRPYNPKVTFIVVQKRHHTRLRPQFEKDGTGKARNIPPGTVVDTQITHPRDFDWFMASHEGLQGTSRPTHYYVLRDDNRFTTDELTEMTYHLCYTYAKATRSVSIPSPVYYAHLAAFRARDHIMTYQQPQQRQRQPQRDESHEAREKRFQQCINLFNTRVQVAKPLKQYMYYC
ncbi:Protein argonaute-3-like protein [Leptotrombidium deliense]|uniref:Protein argonaute-3-like protein n=1 Tax=Leptotrombidium deliense TaxID=299467 RepID=A0A443S8M8_9ACAR|nr:Protein argonaute-3-like protein [Leptotrombidium deliense]